MLEKLQWGDLWKVFKAPVNFASNTNKEYLKERNLGILLICELRRLDSTIKLEIHFSSGLLSFISSQTLGRTFERDNLQLLNSDEGKNNWFNIKNLLGSISFSVWINHVLDYWQGRYTGLTLTIPFLWHPLPCNWHHDMIIKLCVKLKLWHIRHYNSWLSRSFVVRL